ncbi:MAG: UPF0489 family protein [Clostridia bacterium]|nr:UPF0489 family protein [Clostridia bacterium]
MNCREEFEECYLNSQIISGKYVYVFEKHNMALPIWGMIANKLNRPLNLLTFDAHTDTLPAFSSYKTTHLRLLSEQKS